MTDSPCRYPNCDCGIQGCGKPLPDAAKAAQATAERVTHALFPDDFHDGTDCRAEVARIGEPCRVCADNLDRWRNRIREVTAALTAEGLL